MNRTFAGLLFAVAAVLFAPTGRAQAQVVIQGEGQVGGVYGSGTVYVQPQQQQQQQVQVQPSPYVAQPGYGQQPGYVAQPQQPVQTIVHTSPTMALLIPGVIALAGGWLISGVGATSLSQDCTSACPTDDWVGYSWIPLAGPWVAWQAAEYNGGYEVFNVLMGVVQGAGAILIVLGLAIQQEWEEAVYADLGEGRTLTFAGGPSAGGGQVGATLTF